MATSEIEKLERRYAENPQGLTFAPLAEVHRKNGDIARALELLRAGLELHPNYIPASIVLGRCHWDQGDLPAAEAAFAHVLRLDDENVIALKSLADINERLERFGEAQRWLHRLVSVDRSNEEAREQLSRLEAIKERGPRAPTPAQPVPAPPPAPVEVLPHEIAAGEHATTRAEAPPPQAEAPPLNPETKSPPLEFLDISESTQKAGPPLKSEAPDRSGPQGSEPVPGLSTHEFVPPPEHTYRLHPELTQEFVAGKEPALDRFDVEISEEVELQSSGASEFRVPNAAEDFLDLAAQINATRDPIPPPTPEPPRESPAAAAPEPPEPPPAPAKPAPVSKTPERSKPSFSAQDTKGQSVASFFQTLLAARPPGGGNSSTAPSASVPAAAGTAPPTQDGTAPGAAFGPESPPNASPVPSGGQLKDAAVSFDDFFSSAGGGTTSPLPPGGGDPKTDDLDSFQSWLQNLKR